MNLVTNSTYFVEATAVEPPQRISSSREREANVAAGPYRITATVAGTARHATSSDSGVFSISLQDIPEVRNRRAALPVQLMITSALVTNTHTVTLPATSFVPD